DYQTEAALASQEGLEIVRLSDNPFDQAIQFRTATHTDRVLECVVANRDGEAIDRFFYGALTPGSHEIKWSPRNLASGVYYLHFRSDSFHRVEVVAVLR
ncbi:hypothetical protein JW992_04730, partial [candidate division KSB1 bacterium]|nr:hypothetical protein [candidate division KSB1 bacterium]